MKKMIIALLCGLLLLSGCANAQISNNDTGASAASSEKEATTYESQIKKEECALCSQQGNTMLPAYAGQKNLGIICINTFDISPIEINRYDDFGNLIEKPSETFSIMHNGFGEGNMNTHVTPNPDRGYANVDVSFTKDETVDKAAVESLLCSDCLTSIMTESWDEPYGVGVIDFDTLEVRLFEEKITGLRSVIITLRLTTPKKRMTQIQRNLICLSSTVHRDMNKEQAISDCFYDIDVTKNLN